MGRAIRISRNSSGNWGLKMENGKFVWAEDGIQAAQHATIRLLIWYGENELNPLMGTKWYQTIFNTAASRAEKEFEIKQRILNTTGIKRIVSFTWTEANHTATIDAQVDTDWGEYTVGLEVTPL